MNLNSLVILVDLLNSNIFISFRVFIYLFYFMYSFIYSFRVFIYLFISCHFHFVYSFIYSFRVFIHLFHFAYSFIYFVSCIHLFIHFVFNKIDCADASKFLLALFMIYIEMLKLYALSLLLGCAGFVTFHSYNQILRNNEMFFIQV
jgi:hypothetical protein